MVIAPAWHFFGGLISAANTLALSHRHKPLTAHVPPVGRGPGDFTGGEAAQVGPGWLFPGFRCVRLRVKIKGKGKD